MIGTLGLSNAVALKINNGTVSGAGPRRRNKAGYGSEALSSMLGNVENPNLSTKSRAASHVLPTLSLHLPMPNVLQQHLLDVGASTIVLSPLAKGSANATHSVAEAATPGNLFQHMQNEL